MSLHAPILDSGKDEALFKYLPRTLIENWTKSPEQTPIWGQWLTGSLMHVDITGFTAMSESLARMGNEGAEFMASTLNRFFEHMLGIASEWDGVQMKFGGDAMLLLFSSTDHAARAAACGREMQSAMRYFRKIKVVDDICQLRMRIGIHSGRFYSASIGIPNKSLHYFLFGSDVNKAADVEPMAEPGQVVISTETAELINDRGKCLSTKHDGIWRVTQINTPKPGPIELNLNAAPCETLRSYMMPPLAQGRTAGLDGEHRRTTIVFIYLIGTSELLSEAGEKEALGQVDTYMKMVLATVDKYGGYLAASDVSEHGDKLIILFGAPVTHDEQEANAVRFAYELKIKLSEAGLQLQHQIGINSGFVFAGEIGSSWRREYTVIGDNVNLAARLMAAAGEDNILMSESTAKRAGNEHELRRLRPIRVKGKSKPIRIYRLEGLKHKEQSLFQSTDIPFIGRDQEMASLLNLSNQVKRGHCSWAYISGEPGIGKTRLCVEHAQILHSKDWRILIGTCQTHNTQVPFSAWIEPLRNLFDIEVTDSPDTVWSKIEMEVKRLRPDLLTFASLISEILGHPGVENSVTQSLDTKTRHERRLETISELIGAIARTTPVFLFIDDVQWIDGSSLELIHSLLSRTNCPLFICLASREVMPPNNLSQPNPNVSLPLTELDGDVALKLVKSISDLSIDETRSIIERAKGNPLFLKELAQNTSEVRGNLPESIHDVIMIRMDRLADEERSVLQHASVIGMSFNSDTFTPLVAGNNTIEKTNAYLHNLISKGFINKTNNETIYKFINNLTWEVVYETLLYAERRKLHDRIADYLQLKNIQELDKVADTLLYHYESANNYQKTVVYGAITGDKAATMYANSDAIECYKRALVALDKIPRATMTDRSMIMERIGDVYESSGSYVESVDTYLESLDVWRSVNKGWQPKLVPWPLKKLTHNAVLCRKIAVSCEHQSDYDLSLQWLEKALEALPKRPGSIGSLICASKSVALYRKGQYPEALDWGRRALMRAKSSKKSNDIAYAHNMLAATYMEIGRLRSAISHLEKAVSIYKELNDYPGLASANSNLGRCYAMVGELDSAFERFSISLEADERMQNPSSIAMDHQNIGQLLLMRGDLEKAVNHFEKVVHAMEDGQCPPDLAGAALVSLCECKLANNDVESSEHYLRDGLRLIRRTGIQGLLMEAQLLLAEVQLAKGRADEAKKSSQRVLSKIRKLDAQWLEARGERILGNALLSLGDTESAYQHLRNSVTIARRIGADQEEARSLIAHASALAKEKGKSNTSAKKYLQRAIKISSNAGAKLELDQANHLLSTSTVTLT